MIRFRSKMLLSAALIVAFNPTWAVTPASCLKLSKEIIESGRNFRICVTGPVMPAMKCKPFDQQEFLNIEHVLPRAGAGQTYQEGKILSSHTPDKGTMRWVYLSQKQQGKTTVVKQYFTSDHYASFCEFDR